MLWKKHLKKPIIRTLVIEDDEILWKAIESSLRINRFEATFAPDGPSGIQLARKTKPELILLDWQLPGMEGRPKGIGEETVKRIRQWMGMTDPELRLAVIHTGKGEDT